MRHFRISFLVTFVLMAVSGWWGYSHGGMPGMIQALWITGVLGIMEVSLSFDNAVVNAKVLQEMDAVWQRRFLTWGMVIAVFGMRVIFPLAIKAADKSAEVQATAPVTTGSAPAKPVPSIAPTQDMPKAQGLE